MAAAARLLVPLAEHMRRRVLQSRVVPTPTIRPCRCWTPRDVLDGRKTGRVWVYLGDRGQPYTVYDMTRRRTQPRRPGAVPRRDFCGHLQADAFAGYDGIYAPPGVSSKWPVVRTPAASSTTPARPIPNARTRPWPGSDGCTTWRTRAKPLVPTPTRAARGEAESVPLLTAFCQWFDREAACGRHAAQGPIGQAINYALNPTGQRCCQVYVTDSGLWPPTTTPRSGPYVAWRSAARTGCSAAVTPVAGPPRCWPACWSVASGTVWTRSSTCATC